MLGFVKICIAAISWICWSHAEKILEDDSNAGARLVGDTSGTGRLELPSNGQWYPVYTGYFTQKDAIVACRMLGFNDSGVATILPNLFGKGADSVISDDFQCDGSEYSLDQCRSPGNWHFRTSSANVALTCEASKIRLVDGDDSQSGRVEIFILNNWYTVCDSNFDDSDASVLCRMLGYTGSGISRAFSQSHYGQGYGGVIVSDLQCDGSEKDIKQCPSTWGTNNNCDHRRDAGISCSKTQIRLVGGLTNTSGRVEILHAGKWGTICSYGGFTNRDIDVICKMIGHPNPNAFGYSFAFYGEGHVQVMLDHLVCDGTENDISQCSTSTWGGSTCSHSSDVGVNCEGITPIRLRDTDTEQTGRVELYHLGNSGTVSSQNFDRHDLEVICRMLGFNYSSKSFYNTRGYYGEGTGHTVVSRLGCNGDESDIGQCSATWWPNTDSLSHSQDVGVSCDGHIHTRVVGDNNDPAGRVEIYHNRYFHTICGRNFDRADLMVVCRMLGIENIPRSAYWRWTTTYEEGIGTISASHLDCDGSESSIALCGGYMPALVTGSSGCDHSYDIAVNCNGGQEQLRLVDGNTNHSGRVEINIGGSWGTMCDDDFDRADAIVICRVLGYQRPERAIAYSNAHFGQGNVSILIRNLQCNGMEVNIGQCNPSFDGNGCDHSEDSGVDCCPNCNIGGQIIG